MPLFALTQPALTQPASTEPDLTQPGSTQRVRAVARAFRRRGGFLGGKGAGFRAALAIFCSLPITVWAQTSDLEPDLEPAQEADDAAPSLSDVETVLVEGRKMTREPLSIYIDSETLQGIPGTNDDPLQALITLPGTAVNDDFQGGVAIRGTRPGDNTYRIDFMQVGYLFHFGTGSVVDGDLVDGFTFYPAAFGARYQDVIGGAIDVRTRSPKRDDLHGLLDINLVHAGFLVEGPVGEHQRGYFSARKSYYDLVLEPYIDTINDGEDDDIDLVQLPAFYDYRGRYQIDLGDSRLEVLLDGADDDVELLYQDSTTEVLQDPALAGAHRFALAYHRQAVSFMLDGERDDSQEGQPLEVGVARNVSEFKARLGGAGTVDSVVTDVSVRLQATTDIGRHRWIYGGTVTDLDVDYDVVLRDTGCTEFEVDCRFSAAETTTARDVLGFQRTRAFVEDQIRLGDNWRLTLGSAYTRDNYLKRDAFEPRASLSWRVLPKTTVSIATGRYHQLPAFEYIETNLGNPNLEYLRADHYVVGVDHVFETGWSLSTEIYKKESRNLVTANAVSRYDNDGVGESVGAEILLRGHFGPRLIGWASISYSRAEREDSATGAQFDFEYDQPFIASIVAKYRMNETISFSGKAWYHSGPPHSPIVGGEPDPDNPGSFLPVYGEINSERLPSYLRIDLRADWQPAGWNDSTLYFELQNATNHRNVSGYEYEPDYSDRDTVTQVPFFVSVGFRKAW